MCDDMTWDQRIPNEPILNRQFATVVQTPMMLSMRPVSTCGTGRAPVPFPVDNNMIPGSRYNIGVDGLVKHYRPYLTQDCLPENYVKKVSVGSSPRGTTIPVWDINTSRKLAQRDTRN